MKMVTYGERGSERAALYLDASGGHARLVDVARASAVLTPARVLPPDPGELLRQGWLAAAADLLGVVEERLVVNGPDALPGDVCFPRTAVRLGAPVPRPPQIVCVGLNYRDHAREQDKEPPPRPLLFGKSPRAVIGPDDRILVEPDVVQLDYELELGVVMGREARQVRAAQAHDFVAGYMIFLDMTDREAQYGDKQWFRGKSHDTFAPCGPWLLWAPALKDPGALAMRLEVNGEVRQASSTREMIFSVADLVEYITRTITLVPGDIIATGTPAGVGVYQKPPIFLRPGDRLRGEIERLGVLELDVGLTS